MFGKTVLKNGIKVLTEEISQFKSATIGIWVHTGPKDEEKEENGISHFIEHMMFKGTKNRTARDIAEIMDSVGGQINAFTEKEQTCYYARVVDKHIPLAFEVLSDMFTNSLFDPLEIDRERGVILEEIKMYEDDPEDMVFEEFNHTLWGDHPLSRPTLGKKETVSHFTRDDFLKFLSKYYTPDNITVAAAGHLAHENIVDMVEKYFGHLKGSANKKKINMPKVHPRTRLKYKDSEQVYLCMGGEGIPQRDERKFTFFVLDSILGGSMSSRLFQEIREKRGLVYTVSTFTNSYYDIAEFGIYACTGRENLKQVVKLIYSILDDIVENGVTETEVSRAKEHIKGGISLALESTSNRMIRLNKSELYHGRLVPIDEVIEKIDKVTVEDVNHLSKQMLNRHNFAVTVLGPIKGNLEKIIGG